MDGQEQSVSSGSSTPSAPSAPSTPAPSSTPPAVHAPAAASGRPTMADALKQEYGKLEAQRAQAAPATPPVDGTTPPADAPVTEQVTPPQKPQGPIPFEVHAQALANARTKEQQRIADEFRQTYGEPDRVKSVMQWAKAQAEDPAGFLTHVITDALNRPELAPHVVRLAAQALRKGQGGKPPTAPPSTETEFLPPDFKDDQGNTFYSAARADENFKRMQARIDQKLDAKFKPIEEREAEKSAKAEAEQRTAATKATMNRYVEKAKAWPHFAEHEAAIKTELMKDPTPVGSPAEEALLLREIYDRIVGPKLADLEQQKVAKRLKEQALSGTYNPGSTGAPSSVPKGVRAKDGGTFGAALRWAETQQAGR